MHSVWRATTFGLWFGALVTVVLVVATAMARAHEWYPHDCCSDRDCWPTGVGEREPDPVATREGWRLSDGIIVPYNQARPSPDGRFHVCRSGGRTDGAVIQPYQQPPCLWVPQGGV